MHDLEITKDLEDLSYFSDEAFQYAFVSFQSLKETLVLHMIDSFTFVELTLDIEEMLA